VSTQSLVADVIDALLVTWRADATLVAYAGRLRIYDGPPLDDRAAEIELWVGATGLEPDETVLSGEQDWATMLGILDRDETLLVQNAIWVARGNVDVAAARRTALDVFDAATTAVRSATLGLSTVEWVDVPSWSLRQGQFNTGAGAVLTFTVRARGQV
jgi:hypothetical protein